MLFACASRFTTPCRPLLILLASFSLSLFIAASAHAAEYYVAPNGSDSNPGSLAAPWKTPRHAARYALKPGDTVYFRGGDYVIDKWMTFNKPGTSTAPITYKNYQGETPTIVFNPPPNPDGRTALYISGAYSIVDGINFRLPEEVRRRTIIDQTFSTSDGRANQNAVGAVGIYATGGILRNCHIDNFSQTPVYNGGENITVEFCKMTNNASHGLYISSRNSIYRYNVLDGSRGFNNQMGFQVQYLKSKGNKIYGNLVINGEAAGFVISGQASSNEIFNNVFVGAGASTAPGGIGWAIGFYCEDGPIGSGNKIYNNTFIGATASGLINPGTNPRCNGVVPGTRVEIYNNIFHPSTPVQVGLSTPNVNNNIFYNVRGSAPPGNILVNPNLKNPGGTASEDAMLTAGSPAIDKAISPFPINDYQGGKRPFPVGGLADIGAFEFGAPPGEEKGPLGGGVPAGGIPASGSTSGGGGSDYFGLGNCLK